LAQLQLSSVRPSTASANAALFEFLGDFNNFQHLLPQDKIDDFQCTADECSFNIRGITALTIRIAEKEQDKKIVFSSHGLAKYNFLLTVLFNGAPTDKGPVEVRMDAKLNPFIKTFAEKPLGTLVDTIADRIATQVV
jgi:hypothetical protein